MCELQRELTQVWEQLNQQSEFSSSLGAATATLLWRVSRNQDTIAALLGGVGWCLSVCVCVFVGVFVSLLCSVPVLVRCQYHHLVAGDLQPDLGHHCCCLGWGRSVVFVSACVCWCVCQSVLFSSSPGGSAASSAL